MEWSYLGLSVNLWGESNVFRDTSLKAGHLSLFHTVLLSGYKCARNSMVILGHPRRNRHHFYTLAVYFYPSHWRGQGLASPKVHNFFVTKGDITRLWIRSCFESLQVHKILFTVGDILQYLKMSWVNIFYGPQNSVHFCVKYLDCREVGDIYSFRTTKFYALLGGVLRYWRGRGFESRQIHINTLPVGNLF